MKVSTLLKFICVFITLLLVSCASVVPNFEQPDLQLTNLKILSPQGLEQRFRLSFRIVNPNNIGLPVDGMRFKLKLRGIDVATGVSNDVFIIPPLGENQFDVDVSASLFNSGRVLLDIMNARPQELAYSIDAKIFTSKGLWGSIEVNKSGSIGFGNTGRHKP